MNLKKLEFETIVNFLYELENRKILPIHKKVLFEFLNSNKSKAKITSENFENIIFPEITTSKPSEIEKLFNNPEFIQRLSNYLPKVMYAGGGGLGEHDVNRIVDNKISQIDFPPDIPLNPKYFGSNSNNNWRMQQVGDELITEYKYNGVWITQCSCKATILIDDLIIDENETPIVSEDGVFLVF